MYLEKFIIKNFRGISDVSLTFTKGLNILIGENNSGKSTIIDALRICFSYGNQKREIYVSQTDFHQDKTIMNNEVVKIEFHLHYHVEKPEETGWLYDLFCVKEDGTQNLQLHFRFFLDKNNRVKCNVWGGANEGQAIAPEALFLIYHVHLDALRDAEQYLRPIKGNRLGQLYSNIQIDPDSEIDQEKKRELAKKVRTAVDKDVEWIGHITKGKEKINEHLNATSFSDKQQQVDVSFLSFDFNKLVDNLKIQLPLYSDELLEGDKTKQKHFELSQNGLGYNNLIYTATVLGDLKQRKERQQETYTALLIEEPEAHLHPQLQNLFFNYLNKLDRDEGFQIFISSHSPTITAKANLKSVIVLQNQGNKVHALSLSQSGLTDENHKYLQKFLDVTKSQLFFSNGVILVEGISEVLLIPIFSRIIGEEYDIEKSGVELVNINGVAFSHFANLFNNEEETKNLKTRCSLITDDDSDNIGEITSRAKIALNLAKKNLKVFLAQRTFEYELFIAGNKDILLSLFAEIHPNAASRILTDADVKIHAKNFLDKVISNKAKSELAHKLAVKLEIDFAERKKFVVPNYLKNAIKYAVKGE